MTPTPQSSPSHPQSVETSFLASAIEVNPHALGSPALPAERGLGGEVYVRPPPNSNLPPLTNRFLTITHPLPAKTPFSLNTPLTSSPEPLNHIPTATLKSTQNFNSPNHNPTALNTPLKIHPTPTEKLLNFFRNSTFHKLFKQSRKPLSPNAPRLYNAK